MKNKVFYFIVSTMLLLTSCSSEKSDWQDAKKQNTLQIFEQFLKIYPKSTLSDSVSIKIEELYYKAAKEQNKVQAYQQFLDKYPKSIFKDSVINRIRKIEFIEINNKKDIIGIKKFISNYPDASVLNEYQIKNSTSIASQPTNANKGCKITLKELNDNEFTYLLTIPIMDFFNPQFPDFSFDANVPNPNKVKGVLSFSSYGAKLSIIINKNKHIKLNSEFIEIMPNLLIYLDKSEFIISGKDSVLLKRDVSQNIFYIEKGNTYYFKL